MSEYLNKLIEQFKSAKGIKCADVNSKEFMNDFREWLSSRKSMGNDFAEFVDYMGCHPTVFDLATVEVGKGIHDTIGLDCNIGVITPYSEGLDTMIPDIVTANFEVQNDGFPTIIRKSGNGVLYGGVDISRVRRFLTHNPYDASCIRNWEHLHNNKENITVGVFGSIYDKDMEQKIRQIEELKNKMTSGFFKEEYDTSRENYYYAVSSTRKVLIKEKVLHR